MGEQVGPGSRRESESSHAMPSPPPMMQPPMFNPMGSTASVLTPPSIPAMPTNSLTKRPSLDAQKSISPPTVMPPAKQPPMPTPPVATLAPPSTNNNDKKPNADKKKKTEKPVKMGFIISLMPSFLLPPNQVHLPDESEATIVWDEDKKKWVDKNFGGDDDDSVANSAPPSAPGGSGGPPPPMMAGGGNKFSGGLGKR